MQVGKIEVPPVKYTAPGLPLSKNTFQSQAKKLCNLINFSLKIFYNILEGISVLIRNLVLVKHMRVTVKV